MTVTVPLSRLMTGGVLAAAATTRLPLSVLVLLQSPAVPLALIVKLDVPAGVAEVVVSVSVTVALLVEVLVTLVGLNLPSRPPAGRS